MSSLSMFQAYIKKPEEKIIINRKIIGYTRVSSKEQSKNYSIGEQEKEIQEFAKRNNYELIEIIGGTYESASGDFTRKEFKRLYEEIKKGRNKPYGIAIKFINRFSRTGAGAITIVHELVEKLGVNLIETSTGLDTTNLKDRATIYHKLLEAMEENQERLERTLPGMKAFLKSGNWLGSAPFGYTIYGTRVNDYSRLQPQQKMIINDKGRILQKAWQLKLQGERDSTILTKMAELGLVIRKQKLSAIWRRPVYCGISTNSLLDEPIVGNWEPMITKEEFLRVQQLLNPTKGGTYDTSTVNDLRPLARFVICEKCGTPVTGYIVKQKNAHYYKCNVCRGVNMNANTTVRAKTVGLNNSFNSLLKSIELKPEHTELFKMQVTEVFNYLNKESIERERSIEKRLNEIETNIEKLENRYIYDGLAPDVYNRHKSKLEAERAELLSKSSGMNGNISNQLKHLENVAFTSGNISKYWAFGDYAVKDRIQRAVFPEGLIVNPDKRVYLTKNLNTLFLIRPAKSSVSEGVETKKVGENTDLSCQVAGAGLEPTTFGL
ncbi:MAG: recombinase family protein [Flavobacterium sp.]|nr:recombinase family protein [Flavobacterium sp.]